MRILHHPVLGDLEQGPLVTIVVNGKKLQAIEGEPIAAALLTNGVSLFRKTRKFNQPRSVFCCIGRCTDCMMIVDGIPNVRTCITPVKAGMIIETQIGLGKGNELR